MITTICHDGMPGVKSVFRNMENLGISRHQSLQSLTDISQVSTDTVIFGAYNQQYDIILNLIRKMSPETKIGFLWTSSPSETELQGVEIPLLQHVCAMAYNKVIDFVWFLKPDFMEIYNDIPSFHAPAPVPELPFSDLKLRNTESKQISLFVPNTLKKNVFAQLLAMISVRMKDHNITIHTSVPYNTPEIVNTGWMSPEVYLREIKYTFLAMHVSHAESFAYGAYEFLGRGIPTLISPSIARNFGMFGSRHTIWDDLVVNDPDSVSEMVGKILNLTTSQDDKYYETLSSSICMEMTNLRLNNNQKLVVEFKNHGLS